MQGINVNAKNDPMLMMVVLTVRFDYVRPVQQDPSNYVCVDPAEPITTMYFKQERIDMSVAHKITMEMLVGHDDPRGLVLYLLEDMYRKAHPDDDDVNEDIFEYMVLSAEIALLHLGIDITKKYHSGGVVGKSGLFISGKHSVGSLHSPVQSLKDACAGLSEVVDFPMGTQYEGQSGLLYAVIQVLNDTDRWTREQIADWLESLDVDITVTTKE